MPDEYNSSYIGAQIDSAVGKALSPDSTPTADSQNLITSGGVKSAIDNAVVANPPVAGTEGNLTALKVGGTKYKVPSSGGTGWSTAVGIIGTSATSVSVSYSGAFRDAVARRNGKIVLLDVAVGESSVTFSVAEAPETAVTCNVYYV